MNSFVDIKQRIINDTRRRLRAHKAMESTWQEDIANIGLPPGLLAAAKIYEGGIYFYVEPEGLENLALFFGSVGHHWSVVQPRFGNGPDDLVTYHQFQAMPDYVVAVITQPLPEERDLGNCRIVEKTYLTVECER